jgi:hypothetical protein
LRATLQGLNAEIAKIVGGVPVGAQPSQSAAIKLTELENKARDAETRLRQVMAALMDLTRVQPTPTEPPMEDRATRLAAIEEQRAALDRFMQTVQGERTVLETINMGWVTHADVIEQANERIRAAYGNTAEGRRKMADVSRAMALQEQNAMLDTATQFGRTLSALWPQQKGAAVAEAVINTAVAVTKAYTSGVPPWNFAQAALVAAAGLAQISAIRSATPTGGGSVPSVSGGRGAAVSAPPPSTAAGLEPSQSLLVSLPAGRYTAEEVAQIVEGINNAVVNRHVRLVATHIRDSMQYGGFTG